MAGGATYIQNVQTVRELLEAFYGTPFITAPVETAPTIATSAVQIGQQILQSVNKNIINTGATNIAIGFSPAVTVAAGILLKPGGFLKFDWYYDGDLVGRPLWAIGDGAGGTLYVLERCLQGV